jgi:signal transduction histidine kinase
LELDFKKLIETPPLTDEFKLLEKKTKLILIRLLLVLSITIASVYVYLTIINGYYLVAVVDFLFLLTFCVLFYKVKRNKSVDFVSYLMVFIGAVLFQFLIYSGGMSKIAIVWSLIFPVAVSFFVGKNKGFIFSIIFLIITIISIFTISYYSNHSLDFHLTYIGIYLFITFFSYASEQIKTSLQSSILMKNKNLVEKINELEIKDIQLQKEKHKAEVADRLKSEFLAQMSHEIRTPVGTILNYTSLIEQ